MALKKLDDNKRYLYIKISLDGTFKVYKTAKERSLEKQATPSTEIISKYKKIIADLRKDKERCYYDPEFTQLILAWETEFKTYLLLQCHGETSDNLPLIAQYYPDVKSSLPIIITRGRLGVEGDTLDKVYDYVKRCGYFGEVKDC